MPLLDLGDIVDVHEDGGDWLGGRSAARSQRRMTCNYGHGGSCYYRLAPLSPYGWIRVSPHSVIPHKYGPQWVSSGPACQAPPRRRN